MRIAGDNHNKQGATLPRKMSPELVLVRYNFKVAKNINKLTAGIKAWAGKSQREL